MAAGGAKYNNEGPNLMLDNESAQEWHHKTMGANSVETRNSSRGSFKEGNQVTIVESKLREEQAGLNPFSVGQSVRILSNERTIKALQTKLGNKMTYLMVEQVGCVSKVIDKQNVSLEWSDTSLSILSAPVQTDWLESLPVSESRLYETLFQMRWKLADFLVEAAKEGDLFLVQLLIQNYKIPADVQHRSTPGLTSLHVACLEGHLNVIQWLLSEPKSKELLLEKEDWKGRRAIHFAVKGCQLETLNLLIKNGADVDPQTNRGRKTPLHKAVVKLNLECVTMLIENYCNVNLQDSEGNTPLHYSVLDTSDIQVSEDAYKALVNSGRIDFNIRNGKGQTVFHSAVLANNLSAVNSFLEMDIDKIALERVTDTEFNALHLACTKGNLKVAKLLVEKKDLINGTNNSGQTPLMVACSKGFSPLIELLVKAGADVNAMDENCDSAISLMIRRIYLDDLHYGFKTNKTIVFPSTEESPEIYKIYNELSGLPCYKETMEIRPSIAHICYLIRHAGDLNSGRHWISKIRDVNVKVILEGYSSKWKISVNEEQIVVNCCILFDKPVSRMCFVCCGNESCLFCPACIITEKVLRCPCCTASIKPNGHPLPFIVSDSDDVLSDLSEPDEDKDSSPVNHHQPWDLKVDDANLQPTDMSTIKSSDPSLKSEIFRPAVLPIIQIDAVSLSSEDSNNMPDTFTSSPLPSSPGGEPFRNPKWLLRKGAKTDTLEDGLGNYYTRRSLNVWQCTRQSNIQRNKCPATVRIVGGHYILSKNHRHST